MIEATEQNVELAQADGMTLNMREQTEEQETSSTYRPGEIMTRGTQRRRSSPMFTPWHIRVSRKDVRH